MQNLSKSNNKLDDEAPKKAMTDAMTKAFSHLGMSADVFISYAAKDRERVAKLVDGLQKAGVSVWIDMAGIEVASMWSKEIVSAIRDCKVLLFLSPLNLLSPRMW